MSRPVVVVPDLHGRADLLAAAVSHVEETLGPGAHLLSLGDAIDRGPRSLECVETLLDLRRQGRATLLMGNHERMAWEGVKWYRRFQETGDPQEYRRALEGFRWWMESGGESVRRELGGLTLERFPAALAGYLEGLRRVVYVTPEGEIVDEPPAGPSVLVAHASPPAAHPRYPSPESAALWLRPFDGPFALPPGVTYSVHGHTPVPGPTRLGRQVYLDLGAYETGRLALLTVNVTGAPGVTVLQGPGHPSAARRYAAFGEALPARPVPLPAAG